MRPAAEACGCVEPPENYWVDVTVTQSVHVDLATPPSCPGSAPWGGGAGTAVCVIRAADGSETLAPSLTTKSNCESASSAHAWVGWSAGGGNNHPRFPWNGKVSSLVYYPMDQGAREWSVAMDGYLTTCGGWRRDATYRFDATNWNIPQYVYVYAHNDKDGTSTSGGHVARPPPLVPVSTLLYG